MTERKGVITLSGNPMTLTGNELKVGDKLPDVELTANDMSKVKLSSFFGKPIIISAVPSLDTPVCDTETRRFNTEASKLNTDIQIVTVSVDLPFAQKRWCGAAGIDKVKVLSDYYARDFGSAFGILIKEIHLLARTVFVADRKGVIRYIQLVKEVTQEPDYDAVLKATKELV